ncbi:MAG: winged helix-turn-helix domain-containing protein [Pseudomonadota bacterium]
MQFKFQSCVVDLNTQEVQLAEKTVPIEPQVFDVISHLLKHRDRLVSRDELIDEVWQGRFISDSAVSTAIKLARKAIGDDGEAQSLIKTIRGRGFRFVGPVEEISPQTSNALKSGLFAAENLMSSVKAPALAVLPFSGEDRSAADGLTVELTAALTAWRYFPVVSNAAAARFTDLTQGIEHIAQELRTRYLLHGTYRHADGRAKVQVTLTDTEHETQIWTDRIQFEAGNVFELEEELAARIAAVVVPELEAAEARRVADKPQEDCTAWQLSMRAASLISQGSAPYLTDAEAQTKRAIELAPGLILPHALLALVHFQKAMFGFSNANSSEAFEPTLKAAEDALNLDQSSWIGQALVAVGQLWTHHNHDRAIEHLERALDLNPSAAMTYHFAGCILGFAGALERARSHQERLFRIDPSYTHRASIDADLGLWHLLEENWDAAEFHLTRSVNWNPAHGRGWQRRAVLFGLLGNEKGARLALKKLDDLGLSRDIEVVLASYPFKEDMHCAIFRDGYEKALSLSR